MTLIGMSNIGKSRWSKRLAAESGFARIACDALIEERLGAELRPRGFAGIHGVARWMGQPYDPQYPETGAQYLAHERAVMEDVLARLGAPDAPPTVIDTTGSVIYTGGDIAARLRDLTRVVYLEASPEHVTQLFERYMASPKPVIWGDAFAPHAGETPGDALKRCYPELLRFRAARYAALAHVTIPFERHRAADADLMALAGAA